MGAWGAGLYQDDFASDLKSTISLVSKVPASGDRLLEILRERHGDVSPEDDDGTTFWLVVADQFERRGIDCQEALATALSIIDDGKDLKRLEELGLDRRGLAKRTEVLQELAVRLRSPRTVRPRPKKGKPPAFFVDAGEVYAFPTMKGKAVNAWFDSWEQAGFQPDGWGALLILAVGRAFDWLPWCAIASLTVDPQRPPTLEDAIGSKLLIHPQTDGAARCVPRRSHIERMQMQLLGRLPLDPVRAAKEVSRWSVEASIGCGWSISSVAFSSSIGSLPVSARVSELLKSAS
jgi:hypothetical protein